MLIGWTIGVLILIIVLAIVIYLRGSSNKSDSTTTETSEDKTSNGQGGINGRLDCKRKINKSEDTEIGIIKINPERSN